jgi:hypothetical protein
MTDLFKEIAPWLCHICGGEFDTPSGGICERCNGVTCRSHLNIFGKISHDCKVICDKCLTEEEKQKISKKENKNIG